MTIANHDPEKSKLGAREAAKAETRQALIMAGLAAFSEEGLDGPSLDSICKRAGKTRGAFYVHFKDRDDFMASIMELVIGAFADAVIATGDAAGDLEKTVRAFVGAVDESGNMPLTQLVQMHQFMDACHRNPLIQRRFMRIVQGAMRRVAFAVREGQEAGTVRSDVSGSAISAILVALVMGLQTMASHQVPIDIEVAAEDLLRMLRK